MINKTVIGFYPNWSIPNLYETLDYNALSIIAYHGLIINKNGEFDKNNYPPINLISKTHSNNKKIININLY